MFDNSEARTPTLIKQAVDVYNQTEHGDIAPTITAAVGGATQAEQKCLKSVGGGVRPTNLKGEEILPTLVAGIYKQVGTTQDGLSVVVSSTDKVQKPKE